MLDVCSAGDELEGEITGHFLSQNLHLLNICDFSQLLTNQKSENY